MAAERYVMDIQTACLRLEQYPESGRKYDETYRVLVARNHVVFYRLYPNADEVRIVTVIDGRRDVSRVINALK